jgi:hypothetical protein
MGHVDALRAELPRHALGQGPLAPLADGHVGVALAAAHGGGGTGEDEGAGAAGQHRPRHLAADQEGAQAIHLPAIDEGRGLDVDHVAGAVVLGAVHREPGHVELAAHGADHPGDGGVFGDVAGVDAGCHPEALQFIHEGLEALAVPGDEGDVHPSRAKRRASEAPSPGPTPTMSATPPRGGALRAARGCMMPSFRGCRAGPGARFAHRLGLLQLPAYGYVSDMPDVARLAAAPGPRARCGHRAPPASRACPA